MSMSLGFRPVRDASCLPVASDMIRNDKIVQLMEERQAKDIRKLNMVSLVTSTYVCMSSTHDKIYYSAGFTYYQFGWIYYTIFYTYAFVLNLLPCITFHTYIHWHIHLFVNFIYFPWLATL